MVRRALALLSALACLAIVGAVLSPPVEAAAKSVKKKPLRKLTLDPNAEEIELFQGVEEGKLKVELVPMNAFGGNVFIENLTDQPLTVKLPQAAVTVPKHLAQFGGFGGQGGGQQGGFGGGQGGFGGGQGGQQQGGGGFGGQQGGQQGGGGQGGFFGGGGGGFGSIPPEQIAVIPMNTVCLQHGKPEPSPRSDYTLVPVDKFSNDPVLPQFLAMVGTGKIDQQTAQAAAWHLTDKLSWEQLANKPVTRIGQAPTPYFSTSQLLAAQALVAQAKKMADEAPASPATPTTGRVSRPAVK